MIKDTILFIGVVLVICVGVVALLNRKEQKLNEMSYCEMLDYKVQNSKFINQKQVALLEKMVAIQSGQCKE